MTKDAEQIENEKMLLPHLIQARNHAITEKAKLLATNGAMIAGEMNRNIDKLDEIISGLIWPEPEVKGKVL